MWINNIFKKKQEQQPLDDRYLDALFRNLLRAGNLLEIQDNALSYIQDGYQGNADIYSIIRRYITMSTQAKLVLKKESNSGRAEVVTDHELNKFLINVNPMMTMNELREAYAIYLLSTGNIYWYTPTLEYGINKGKSNELYVLPSHDIEIIQGNNKITAPVSGYKLISSTTEFEPNDVYHSKYFNPLIYTDETLFGQSPIKAAQDVLSKQIQAAKTEAKQMENQGPAYLIFRKGMEAWANMSDPQKAELEKELNGVTKRGKQGGAMVMKDEYGIERLGLSPSDLKIIESTQDGRRILCNVYQLPVGLFNDPEGSTYNNIVQSRKAAWTDAIIPFNTKFTDDLNACLVSPVEEYVKGGYFFDMDYNDVSELQSELKEKVEWMAKAHWSANQILQATGQDKIDKPEMDEPIFGRNDIFLNEMSLDVNLDNKDYGDYK